MPTAHEQGLKNFDADGWNAFFFPRGTPDPIVRKLAQATASILDMPDVRARLEKAGLNVAAAGAAHPGLSRQARGERARQVGTAGAGLGASAD